MALSATSFEKGVTRQEALDSLFAIFKELGFRTTSWQPGSVQRTLITAAAWLYSGATQATRRIFLGGYPTTAALVSDSWLDLILEGFYQETRLQAVSTKGTIRLISDGTTGAQSWNQNEILISDTPNGSSGIVFHNTLAGAINSSQDLPFEFEAVTPGRAANISSSLAGTTLYLLTPIPGVTAKIFSDPLTGTWITTAGDDRETNDRYLARALARWATLAYGSAHRGLAYKRWAMEADSTITDVKVLQGANAAEVRVICRTLAGGITGGQITAIGNYIEDGRRPINDVVSVESATLVNVPVVAAPVIRRGSLTQGQIEAALNAYFSVLPIGGKLLYPAIAGAVIYEDLVETMLALEGLFRARLSDPVADVALGATDIAVPQYTLTITEVSSEGT